MKIINHSGYKNIFSDYKAQYNPVYLANVDTDSLDFDFLMNYGMRQVPYMLEDKTSEDIIKIIYNHFNEQWTKAYNVLMLSEYNPIENYSMEEHNYELGSVHTSNASSGTGKGKQERVSGIYGFNSVGSNESDNESASSEHESSSNVTSDTSFDNRDTKRTRNGNIGVTTTQQMIESELKLRSIDLIKGYFSSIANYLTVENYE